MRGPFFFLSQGFSIAVQLVVRIRGEALGSPTGMAISQRLSWRFTSIPLTLAKERPPRSSLRLADDEIRAKGREFDSHELGIGGFIK